VGIQWMMHVEKFSRRYFHGVLRIRKAAIITLSGSD